MTRFFRSSVVAALTLATLSTSAFAGKKMPIVVDDALAYALTDRSKAVQLLEDKLAQSPNDKDYDQIAVMAGEQRRLSGDFIEAHEWFTSVIARNDKTVSADAARVGLTLLQAGDLGNNLKALSLLTALSEKNALATQNADRFLLLAVVSARADNASDVLEYSELALDYATEDPEVEARVRGTLEQLAAGVAEPTLPIRGDSKFTLLERVDLAINKGDKAAAQLHAQKALSQATAGSADERAANYALQRINAVPVNSRKVAVLLPLEGKYGAVGKQVRESLEYGHKLGHGNFIFDFIDSGASAETAVKALENAVLERGVIAVVGPLLSDETAAVVEAAEALRVPLISLSQSLEDADANQWVVQAMMTPGEQITALLDEVMDNANLKNFAVFAPQNGYGERATEAFTTQVEARGGSITVTEFYDPSSTDLISHAKTLGRKDYDARSREFYDLKKEAGEKGGNPDRVVLPPVIDFDAIFIPDNAVRVPLACAALAYEEFPMGDFQPTKDSPFIPLLGLSGWNNHNLVSTGGPYTRQSYFVDAFLTAPNVEEPAWTPPPEVTLFVTEFRAELGRTPTALEALTVDAGRLLAGASLVGSNNRIELRDSLFELDVSGTLTGATSFNDETHRATHKLLILSLSEDAIVPHAELPQPIYE